MYTDLISKLPLSLFNILLESTRSSQWKNIRNEYVKYYSVCQFCFKPVEVVHHIQPFHLYRTLELDWNNLVSLCNDCHLKYGHFGDYRSFNPLLKLDILLYQYKPDLFMEKYLSKKENRPYNISDSTNFIQKFLPS